MFRYVFLAFRLLHGMQAHIRILHVALSTWCLTKWWFRSIILIELKNLRAGASIQHITNIYKQLTAATIRSIIQSILQVKFLQREQIFLRLVCQLRSRLSA